MDKGDQFVEQTQSPEGAAAWKQQLDEFAPGASDWVVGAVFGGTYQRPGIELRDRPPWRPSRRWAAPSPS